MFLTKKVVLCLLWLSASALILSAAPSLPAEAPGASDAGATSACGLLVDRRDGSVRW